MPDQQIILVFKSNYLTFKAESAFKKADIPCKVVTKPRGISSDCGLAVRISEADESRASEMLATAGIEPLVVWK